MSRYDGLIIPRSYSEYINKTDAATLLQALQQSGVMDAAPTSGSNHPAKSGGIYSAIEAKKPVDTVALNNMKSVTSNAVANAINVSPVTNKWVFARLHTANTVVVSFTNQIAHFSRAMLDNVANNETVVTVFASASPLIPVFVTSRFDSDGFTLWSPLASSSIELQLWGIVSRS